MGALHPQSRRRGWTNEAICPHPAFLLSSLRAYAARVYKKWGSRQKNSVPPTPKWREKETNVRANRAPTNPADHTSGERSTRSQETDIPPQILWYLYDLISGSSIAARHFEHGSERFRAINLGVHIAHVFAPAAAKEVCARKLDGMWSLIGQLGGGAFVLYLTEKLEHTNERSSLQQWPMHFALYGDSSRT